LDNNKWRAYYVNIANWYLAQPNPTQQLLKAPSLQTKASRQRACLLPL
jgi:hypothetical protein